MHVKLILSVSPLGIPIPSELTPGLNKDYPTKSVLKIIPTMTDDRLKYSCLVHNRAISKENASEAEVFLNVFCKCSLLPSLFSRSTRYGVPVTWRAGNRHSP